MPRPTTQQTPTAPSRPDRHQLETAIAEAVSTTPGVLRLEATLGTIGLRGLIHRHPTDGVHITVRDQLVDADINITTNADCQARAVAEHLHDLVTDMINTTGHRCGTILINVLTIDPSPPHRTAPADPGTHSPELPDAPPRP